MDYYTKLNEYQEAGVREYWIVDPQKKAVIVYYLETEDIPVIYRFEDRIRVNIYGDLFIDFRLLKV